MSQKWNLQDIRPPEPRKRRPVRQAKRNPDAVNEQTQTHASREEVPSIVITDDTNKTTRSIIIAVVIFIVVVGGAVGLSAALGKTELTIFPENREPTISAEFTAFPDKRPDSLAYNILTLESVKEAQVSASGQVEVQELATGVIEIIKTTPGAERLITNTRFRAPNGLVFRIVDSVVVPGAVTDESGAKVPGRIQAEVFADDVGEEYNLAANTTFDVPGFKEGGFTELYNAISATNPTPFTDGFDGLQFQIDDDQLATARQALQVDLRDVLLARIDGERPAGTIHFPGSVAITYNELPAVKFGADLVTIREQAVLQIPLFQAGDLASFLASEAVVTYEGGPIRIEDPSKLTFTYKTSTTSNAVIANEPSLTFSLTGRPHLIWEYDDEELASNLAGLPKTAINNVVASYPGITAARVRITPFWQRSFPDDAEDIIIIEKLDQDEL